MVVEQEWTIGDLIALGALLLAFVGLVANVIMFIWSRRVNTKQALINSGYAKTQDRLNTLLLQEKEFDREAAERRKTYEIEESLKAKFEVEIDMADESQFEIRLKNIGNHDAKYMGFFFVGDEKVEIIRNGLEDMRMHKLTTESEEALIYVKYTPCMTQVNFTLTWHDGRDGTQINNYSADVSLENPQVYLCR